MSDFTPQQLQMISSLEESISASIKEYAPWVDVEPSSTTYEIVVRNLAIQAMRWVQSNEDFLRTNSISGVLDGSLTDEEAQKILDNYFLKLKQGEVATGVAKVVLSSQTPWNLPEGSRLVSSEGLEFFTTEDIRTSGDLVAQPGPSSTWNISVPIRAGAAGSRYNLPAGDMLSLPSSRQGVVSITVSSLSGGSDSESPADLRDRVRKSLSLRGMSTPDSIAWRVREAFPSVRDIVAVRPDSSISWRSRNNPLGLSMPGRIDLYVRTFSSPVMGHIDKEVTQGTDGNYFVRIRKNEVKGAVLFVDSVSPLDGSWVVESMSVRRVLSPVESAPSGLPSPRHQIGGDETMIYGSFSSFVDHEVQITSEDPITEGDVVRVVFFYAPDISDIQNFIDDPMDGVSGADVLVRSMLPCRVSISSLRVRGSGLRNRDIRGVVSDSVANAKIAETLSFDRIVDDVRRLPGVSMVETPILGSASILIPDAPTIEWRSHPLDGVLTFTPRIIKGVAGRIVAFYSRPEDISLELIETQ